MNKARPVGGIMRPFYRKDLFREEIITSNPISYQVKIDSTEMKFETLKMEKGQSISLDSEHYEVGVIILSGMVTIETDGFKAEDIGGRKDVFSGKPTAVYMPCETIFTIKATGYGSVEVALCKTRALEKRTPYIVEAHQVVEKEAGFLNWQRKTHEIFAEDDASRLIIGETYGCPGSWAVYPYKEDNSKAVFHFKVSPAQSKRIQVMRDAENPKAYYIQDDTTICLQSSYLPVPEVEENLYFLWFKMAQ